MTKLNCVSRAKHTAAKIGSESDFDEWLREVDLRGSYEIRKKPDGLIQLRASELNLIFRYGDWIVWEEETEDYKVYTDDSFNAGFEVH